MYWSNMSHQEWYDLNREQLTTEQQVVFEKLLRHLEYLKLEIESYGGTSD